MRLIGKRILLLLLAALLFIAAFVYSRQGVTHAKSPTPALESRIPSSSPVDMNQNPHGEEDQTQDAPERHVLRVISASSPPPMPMSPCDWFANEMLAKSFTQIIGEHHAENPKTTKPEELKNLLNRTEIQPWEPCGERGKIGEVDFNNDGIPDIRCQLLAGSLPCERNQFIAIGSNGKMLFQFSNGGEGECDSGLDYFFSLDGTVYKAHGLRKFDWWNASLSKFVNDGFVDMCNLLRAEKGEFRYENANCNSAACGDLKELIPKIQAGLNAMDPTDKLAGEPIGSSKSDVMIDIENNGHPVTFKSSKGGRHYWLSWHFEGADYKNDEIIKTLAPWGFSYREDVTFFKGKDGKTYMVLVQLNTKDMAHEKFQSFNYHLLVVENKSYKHLGTIVSFVLPAVEVVAPD